MALDVILNDHSYQPMAETIISAQQRMKNLLDTIGAMRKLIKTVAFRAHQSLDQHELAPNYPISRWRNDPSVDADLKRRYCSFATQSPLLIPVLKESEIAITDKSLLEEFHYDEQAVPTLGLVYHLSGIALSFATDACWNTSQIEVNHTYFDDDEELQAEMITILHSSIPSHLADHAEFIQHYIQRSNHEIQYMDAQKAEAYLQQQTQPEWWQIQFDAAFSEQWADFDHLTRLIIHESIREVQKDPMTKRGSRVKPLLRELIGRWRYRTGDYRMIYEPVPEHHTITIHFRRSVACCVAGEVGPP